ncbi:MAG TPA: M48 family metallopeptidase, partial [Noviherbaspirillum sp.]|nr:M48 family metallopeptidase [Noviherbaspirillum sp.]
MNFFEQQEHARRQTRKLVILFILAVIAIVVAVNVALAFLWSWTANGQVLGVQDYPRGFFATNTFIVLAMIGGGTLIETFRLREGGDAVARMAGGRLVSPATTDAQERRLLNVVEEMALASGVACPRVYLLDQEQSINAFAAGYNQDHAVIGVTRGTMERLTRDELQGVIAHEFSHILNGDMRMNIRLIGLLFGIQMLAAFGQHLMSFGSRAMVVRSRDDRGGQVRAVLLLTGVALFVIGYIGVIFGRLIKSAVSRQREFLADASAVQFTRNPDGIGGALRKIGGLSRRGEPGSQINHPNAEQLSHLFLGAPRQSMISGWLATHPPIEERLRRIFGRSMPMLEAPPIAPAPVAARTLPDIPYTASGFAGDQAQDSWMPAGTQVAANGLPPAVDSSVHDPFGAAALVYAMLLNDGGEGRARQLALLEQQASVHAKQVTVLAGEVAALPRSARLPLLDRAMPALLM